MSDRIDLPTPPPCPWWCTGSSSGHRCEYDSVDIDDPTVHVRIHSRAFGSVSVVQSEANQDGRVTLEPVKIGVYVEDASSAAEAQQLSADLAAASDLMARIARAGAPRTIRTEAGDYVVPPCPSWCVLPADHDLDVAVMREYDGSVSQMHSAGEHRVESVDADSYVRVELVSLTMVGPLAPNLPDDRAEIHLESRSGSSTLTADQARAAAAELVTAAELLDAINGVTR